MQRWQWYINSNVAPPQSKGIATCGDGGGRKANEVVVQFPPTPMKTTHAPTKQVGIQAKYSMHFLPPHDQTSNKEGKNVAIKIVEFWKKLSPHKFN